MSGAAAIAAAEAYFDQGGFAADLARRVAIPTESQIPERAPVLARHLVEEIGPTLARLGFATEIVDNPKGAGPMLIAERHDPGAMTTVFGYGHADAIRRLQPECDPGFAPRPPDRPGHLL